MQRQNIEAENTSVRGLQSELELHSSLRLVKNFLHITTRNPKKCIKPHSFTSIPVK